MELPAKPKLDIEEVFASKGRTKILHMLIQQGEMSISAIVQQGKLNHDNVQGHLQELVRLGLVLPKVFGRIKIFAFNGNDRRARALRNLVEFWENRTFEAPPIPGGVPLRV